MSVFLVVSGLFGCRSSKKHTVDDIISFHTFYYGIIGLMLSFVTVGKMKAKLTTVRAQAAANSYMKNGSMNITDSREMFLYKNVTRTKRSSESSGGGSSTHTSSSGTSHGGGGGKF